MVSFKKGVRGHCAKGTLRKEGWIIIEVAETVYEEIGKDCVVTSICDGQHSKNSLHYFGNAVDLRTRHLSDDEKIIVRDNFKSRLGADYDVVLESTHLHVEYDPK